MYYTARGKDLTQQNRLDINTAQRFLDILTLGKSIQLFFDKYNVKKIVIAPFNHFAKCLVRLIDTNAVEVVAIFDQLYYKLPKEYKNVAIKSYESVNDIDADLYIITSNYYQNEIIDTFQQHNVQLNQIIGINTLLYGMEYL